MSTVQERTAKVVEVRNRLKEYETFRVGGRITQDFVDYVQWIGDAIDDLEKVINTTNTFDMFYTAICDSFLFFNHM